MDREGLKLDRPNAWLSEIERVAALLDRVYAHTSGEIWLFDNDLKVLEDHPRPDHKGAFEVLYNQRLDGSLATRVRCVKILLRRGLFDEFCDSAKRKQLFENLCSLCGDRLDTFFVGCLDDVHPPRRLGGHHPWIFYLGQGHLQSQDGIVIVRPHVYPFSYEKDDKGDIAIAWTTSDPELDALHFRLARDWFTTVFVTEYETHFKSVNSERDATGKVVGYHLAANARSDHEIDELWWKLQADSPPPVLPPVDCVIVTALGEEFRAAVRVLGLVHGADGESATGRLHAHGGDVSFVATKSLFTGSVHAAARTARMIERWRPKCVVLLGRCAGAPRDAAATAGTGQFKRDEDDRQEGDVVIATGICAYEYQALRSVKGTIEPQLNVRWVPVSMNLLAIAQALIRDGWTYDGDPPEDWDKVRRPKALEGLVASGCKVLRAGAKWFEELKDDVGAQKILAGEMEAEGVGSTVEAYAPSPEFLFIKGISDFGDPQKGDVYNDFSSSAAAAFLKDLMSRSDFIALLRRIEDATAV